MQRETRLRAAVLDYLRTSLRTPLVRNSAFLLLTAVIAYGLGFVFWLLVARLYSPDVVGLTATLLGTILFLATVAQLGFQIGLIRFLPEEEDRSGLINAALTATLIASLVVALIFLLGINLWASALAFLARDPVLSILYVLSVAGFAIGTVIDTTFIAARRAVFGMVRHAIYDGLRLSLVFVFALLVGISGLFVSWTVAVLVSVGIGAVVLIPRLYPGFRIAPTLRHLRSPGVLGYSAWNQAAVVVGTAAISLMPLVILNTPGGGAAAAAYFYAAFTIASLLYIVPASFTTSLFVEGSHRGAGYTTEARRTVWLSTALLIVGIAGAVLLGPWILGFFGADYVQAGYPTLVVLSVASPIVLANAILSTDLRVAKRVRPLLWITLSATLATLVTAYLLIPILGTLGAGVGFVLGQALALVMLAIERERHRSSAIESSRGRPGEP